MTDAERLAQIIDNWERKYDPFGEWNLQTDAVNDLVHQLLSMFEKAQREHDMARAEVGRLRRASGNDSERWV